MTVLPELLLPEGTPIFMREGHEIELMPVYGDLKMTTGPARRRRSYASAPQIATVGLELSLGQAANFYQWYEGPLKKGERFFSCQVANFGVGLLWWKSRFVGTYQADYLGGLFWKITAKLMLFGDGSVDPPVPTGLTGGVEIDHTGTGTLTVGQPLNGAVTLALLPVDASGAFLFGAATLPLAYAFFQPMSVGYAAGTSTVTGISVAPSVGNAAGTSTVNGYSIQSVPYDIQFASSDRVNALVVGTNVESFRVGRACTMTEVRASLDVASTSGLVTLNIKKNGVTIFSTQLTFDANEKTTYTAATPAVLSTTALAIDDEISVDIVTAGTGAIGLTILILTMRQI